MVDDGLLMKDREQIRISVGPKTVCQKEELLVIC